MDGAEFVMGKVMGDKVRDKGVLLCAAFTLSKKGRPRRILSSRVTKCNIHFKGITLAAVLRIKQTQGREEARGPGRKLLQCSRLQVFVAGPGW